MLLLLLRGAVFAHHRQADGADSYASTRRAQLRGKRSVAILEHVYSSQCRQRQCCSTGAPTVETVLMLLPTPARANASEPRQDHESQRASLS